MYRYRYTASAVGFVCEVYDKDDTLLGQAPGFSKKDAKRRAQLKTGIKKFDQAESVTKRQKTRKKSGSRRKHEPRGSVMMGLQGMTGAKNWRYTK